MELMTGEQDNIGRKGSNGMEGSGCLLCDRPEGDDASRDNGGRGRHYLMALLAWEPALCGTQAGSWRAICMYTRCVILGDIWQPMYDHYARYWNRHMVSESTFTNGARGKHVKLFEELRQLLRAVWLMCLFVTSQTITCSSSPSQGLRLQ